jgi:hypothetical protein
VHSSESHHTIFNITPVSHGVYEFSGQLRTEILKNIGGLDSKKYDEKSNKI